MKAPILFICIFLISFSLFAQEQLGIRLDNYGGINTIQLNPANSQNLPFKWDINLGEISFFAANNYAYLEKTNVLAILSRLPEPDVAIRFYEEPGTTFSPETLIAEFFEDKKKRFITVSGSVLGPSALVQLPNRHTLGFMTRMRMGLSAQDLPTSVSHYTYYFREFEDEFSILPFQGTFLTWNELGLHYSKGFSTYDGEAQIGINIKYLQGYESAYFQNHDRLRFTKFPDDIITTTQADISFGLTTSNISGEAIEIQRNGVGAAFDLGFNMVISEYEDTYRWKIGASVLDVGRIRFNNNAERHVMKRDSLQTIVFEDYEFAQGITDLRPVIDLFSEQTLGDAEATLTQNEFDVWLPTAFSLQVDYAFNENLYLNATVIQRIHIQSPALKRGNLFALVPRYESRWISAALPLVYYNYQNLRVGASLRLAYLTIGTDHLGSLIVPAKFSSSDFYVALKFNPFRIGSGFKQRKGRNRGKVRCPEFD